MRKLILCLLLSLPLAAQENPADRELFLIHCASCLGAGDGPAAAALDPPPRNLHQRPCRYGCCAMPAFEKVLTEQQWRNLADYVSGLGRP